MSIIYFKYLLNNKYTQAASGSPLNNETHPF